jgi:membrane protease YdiL (CAAX protease family)
VSALIPWCVIGLAGWWWLLRRTPRFLGGHAPAGEWHAGDAVFATALALYFIVGIFADDGKSAPITKENIQGGILGYVMISALFSMLVFVRGQTPQQAFGLVPARPLRVIGLGILCIVLTYPLVQLAEQVVAQLGHSASDGDEMVQFLRGKLSASDITWMIVLAVIVAPITEELVFRGYLYGVIKKYGGQVAAMFTSALLFAAVHHNLPAMPALAILAIGLTLAYEITGSLWAPIAMHMLFNLAPVVVLLWFPEWISKP